jgi:hypothetical protein
MVLERKCDFSTQKNCFSKQFTMGFGKSGFTFPLKNPFGFLPFRLGPPYGKCHIPKNPQNYGFGREM